MALPEVMSLRSLFNRQFLLYHPQKDQTHGLLKFAGQDPGELAAQFEVEKAKTWGFDGLVHIKSRYNNKYLVRWTPDSEYMIASAYAPDENQTSWSCTLFEPEILCWINDEALIRLRHIQLNLYLCFSSDAAPFHAYLCATKEPMRLTCRSRELFTVVNWASYSNSEIVLPKVVAFKGDNGKYLAASKGPHLEQYYLKFSFEDPCAREVAHEIYPTPEGIIYVKSKYMFYDFWRTTHNDMIVADADDPLPLGTKNVATMFRLVVVNADKNLIALQNMNSSRFCERVNDGNYKDYLGDTAVDVNKQAILKMIDLCPAIQKVHSTKPNLSMKWDDDKINSVLSSLKVNHEGSHNGELPNQDGNQGNNKESPLEEEAKAKDSTQDGNQGNNKESPPEEEAKAKDSTQDGNQGNNKESPLEEEAKAKESTQDGNQGNNKESPSEEEAKVKDSTQDGNQGNNKESPPEEEAKAKDSAQDGDQEISENSQKSEQSKPGESTVNGAQANPGESTVNGAQADP